MQRMVATLATRVSPSADATAIADAAIAVWHDFATTLQSIIGKQGVIALFNRGIALAAPTYPWLSSSRAAHDLSVDIDGLQAVIALQSREAAIAGAGRLLQTFYDLLEGLIGAGLCERLLDSAREDLPQTDRGTPHL